LQVQPSEILNIRAAHEHGDSVTHSQHFSLVKRKQVHFAQQIAQPISLFT